ncbi:MAG: hypothetical protein K1W24_14805 [Lachnospiraceae bacterium]
MGGKIKPAKGCSAGCRYFISFGIFILLYIVGIILPLDATPHYYNLMSRIWNWTEILVLLLAVYYIARTKIFQWKQAAISLFLGIICLVSLFRDPRTADIIITSICVTAAFYAGCNLQMAIGMHWFIDFTRFAAGF